VAAHAGQAADAALHRLDDAFRQYLAERSPRTMNVEDVGALVGGASRVRRAGESLTALRHMADGGPPLERCGPNLDRELHALHSWYVALGYALVHGHAVPQPHSHDVEGRDQLLACVREASRGRDKGTVDSALVLLWTSQHLDNLRDLEVHLGATARASDGGG
ncbi:MAG TPA: hypothetical protein VGD00_02175, partial [Solirubrobacteraceae bacterium]